MNERTTYDTKRKKKDSIYPPTKTSGPRGMETRRQRDSHFRKVSASSGDPLPVEKGSGARSSNLFKRQETQDRSLRQEARKGKSKVKRGPDSADPGAHAFKKRDELGLSNRPKGGHYSPEQRQRIIDAVAGLIAQGQTKTKVLRFLQISRSTYYGWLKKKSEPRKPSSPLKLTDAEEQAVLKKKKTEPQLSHRQVSGHLRQEGYWVSPSSCYRRLKEQGWVSKSTLRETPWKVPRYEPFRPNQIWGEDWTQLAIAGLRYYLLTLIDYFSRYIVAWGIVKTVTHREVQDLLVLACLSQEIDPKGFSPLIRVDQGSPNIAGTTKEIIRELGLFFSPSRVHRPSDNSRMERWYRTVKQEEIYLVPDYLSEEIARTSLGQYIEYYNKERPHQALWNYPPAYVHRLGNKTTLLNLYRGSVQIAKEQRMITNSLKHKNHVSDLFN